MKATFVLAAMVGICFWSTSGRSSTFESPSSTQEPDECIDLADIASTSIKTNYDLANIKVNIAVSSLCDQMQNLDSKIDFLTSVSMAMDSFLNDDSDIESPLSLTTDLAFADLGIDYTYPVPPAVKVRAKEILVDLMNRSTAAVKLLAREDAPEGGESVDENWILLLQIKDLSDHSFWSVVDRRGINSTYNYGFN